MYFQSSFICDDVWFSVSRLISEHAANWGPPSRSISLPQSPLLPSPPGFSPPSPSCASPAQYVFSPTTLPTAWSPSFFHDTWRLSIVNSQLFFLSLLFLSHFRWPALSQARPPALCSLLYSLFTVAWSTSGPVPSWASSKGQLTVSIPCSISWFLPSSQSPPYFLALSELLSNISAHV